MSRMVVDNLECPHCGNKQEATVWSSVDVTLDPELKTNLFNGEINLFDCEKCGKKSFIDSPLLYHDMTRQFYVQYYPLESLNNPDFIRRFNPDGTLTMIGIPPGFEESGAYLTGPHFVFDMAELMRYVLFRDRIGEMRDQ